MNSRRNISLSEFSRGQWPDEPPEPPRHPSDPVLVARVRSWLGTLGPLTSSMQSWLNEPDRFARMRASLAALTLLSFARMRASLTALTPLSFARYLVAFFVGVVATAAWQSSGGGPKEKPLATASAALAPAALDSMRQSIDKLAAEITRIRAVEQDILERVSAPQQPLATPAHNSARRSPSAR